MENENITLQWTYTLDGAPLDEVEVLFTPDSSSPSERRVARYRTGGTTQVANDFQVRFVFSLTDSQSTIIIHFSQRSDSGTYELVVSPDDLNLAALKDKVKISVKCKWNFFLWFSLRDLLLYKPVVVEGLNWSILMSDILVNRGTLSNIHGL